MTTTVQTFGPAFTKELVAGCASLSTPEFPVPPEWVLMVICFESAGFDPHAHNPSGARGLWQKMPEQVTVKGSPVVLPPGSACPSGCVLRNVLDKEGKLTGHTVWRLYPCPTPEVQIADAFRFWRAQRSNFQVKEFRSLGALYCLNLAPARLANGSGPEVVLYSTRKDLHPREYAPTAYAQNKGLDNAGKGWICIGDLEEPLKAAANAHRERFEAEVMAAHDLGPLVCV